MAESTQSYANHTRWLPAFHFFLAPILIANLVITGRRLMQAPSFDTTWGFVMAFALVTLALLARTMALSVQDRVIRLEMRLRLQRLLPPDLHPKINELTHRQLVAMRFASDEEMPELCRDVLAGKLATPKAIKTSVKNWQADFLRV
jgi:hypothetical protein